MLNPIRLDATETTDLAILAAHDAFEGFDPRATRLTVGLPATISIGCDSYIAKVVAATAKTITAEFENGETLTFRCNGQGWRSKGWRLSVGEAVAKWDPSY